MDILGLAGALDAIHRKGSVFEASPVGVTRWVAIS
jgi:hypothetical protein